MSSHPTDKPPVDLDGTGDRITEDWHPADDQTFDRIHRHPEESALAVERRL